MEGSLIRVIFFFSLGVILSLGVSKLIQRKAKKDMGKRFISRNDHYSN